MMTVELSTTERPVLKKGVSEYKFTGVMSVSLARGLAGMAFDAIDISETEFEEKEVEEHVCLGWSHCGPVYGRSYMRRYNALDILIEGTKAKHLVLPASLTRKRLNAVKRNDAIRSVAIPDDAKLFSMKDGNLYNKKGTILMFSNKPVK